MSNDSLLKVGADTVLCTAGHLTILYTLDASIFPQLTITTDQTTSLGTTAPLLKAYIPGTVIYSTF